MADSTGTSPAVIGRDEGSGTRPDAIRPNEHHFVVRIELAGLSCDGKRACGEKIQKFGGELAHEASLIEARRRPTDVKEPEITAEMISVAYTGVMQAAIIAAVLKERKGQRTWKDRGIELTAALGMAGAGFTAGYLHAKWQVALFTILAVLGILGTLYVVGRQR